MILPETPEALAAYVRDANTVSVPLLFDRTSGAEASPSPEGGSAEGGDDRTVPKESSGVAYPVEGRVGGGVLDEDRTEQRTQRTGQALGDGLSFAALSGEIQHDVPDGVVSCLAGTTLAELNAVLGQDERCVPYAKVWPAEVDRLADLILLGLPHAAEGRYGSWRDWILGATMVTAEGEIVKSGSRVVKSVAGYDAHKLLVGSRGALILPARVSLRTFHISAGVFPQAVESLGENLRSILRVRLTDIRAALENLGGDALLVDESTGTLWTSRTVPELPTFPYSWAIDPFRPSVDERLLPLHRRAKAVLDPGGKLAPGAFHNV